MKDANVQESMQSIPVPKVPSVEKQGSGQNYDKFNPKMKDNKHMLMPHGYDKSKESLESYRNDPSNSVKNKNLNMDLEVNLHKYDD